MYFKYTWHCPNAWVRSLDLMSASRYFPPFLPMVFKHKRATSVLDFAPFLANFCLANSQIFPPLTTIRFSLNKVSNGSPRQNLPGLLCFGAGGILSRFKLPFLGCRASVNALLLFFARWIFTVTGSCSVSGIIFPNSHLFFLYLFFCDCFPPLRLWPVFSRWWSKLPLTSLNVSAFFILCSGSRWLSPHRCLLTSPFSAPMGQDWSWLLSLSSFALVDKPRWFFLCVLLI